MSVLRPLTLILALATAGAAAAADHRYACDGAEVTVLSVGEGLVMATPAGLFALAPVPAASGAKYEAEDDAGTYFWSRGTEAMVGVAGIDLPPCTEIPPAGEWHVGDIAGAGVIDMAEVTITFSVDGQVSGHAACNRFSGSYEVEAGSLSFAPFATTRMACAEAVMAQESAFLGALDRVRGFAREAAGGLVLTDMDGAPLVTARR